MVCWVMKVDNVKQYGAPESNNMRTSIEPTKILYVTTSLVHGPPFLSGYKPNHICIVELTVPKLYGRLTDVMPMPWC